MSGGEGISNELSLGEVLSKTFDIYRRNFLKFLILFLIVGAVTGVLTTLVERVFVLPTAPPVNATNQQLLDYVSRLFSVLIPLFLVILVISLVITTIAIGSAIKMTSDQIERGQVQLGAPLRFAVSKWISIIVVTILVGIIVSLGLAALIVPGIILGIMFCLAIPVVIIEPYGVAKAFGRSRELVSHRWLKTFVFALVLGIIVGILELIVSGIAGLSDGASTIVSSILSAFYLPLYPIGLTVYYYSNVARLAPPPQMPQPPFPPYPPVPEGLRFCPSCGAQLSNPVSFCPQCGTKLPT